MTILTHIRHAIAHRAEQRRLRAELAALTDAELNDLNLSYAKVMEMSRVQAIPF